MRKNHKDEISDNSDDNWDDEPTSDFRGSPGNSSESPDSAKPDPGNVRDGDSDSGNNSSDDCASLSRNSCDESNNMKQSEPDSLDPGKQKVHKKKSASVKSTFNFDELTSDDEIYMFQCPATYNMEELCGKNLGTFKSDVNETEGYQFEFLNSEKEFITLAVPGKSSSGKLLKLPLRGHITLKKVVSLPAQDHEPEDACKNSEIVFPDDIKLRHPLLGVDWEAHIKVANEVNKKTKHIKKSKAPEIEEEEVRSFKREGSEIETPVKKKKKSM